MSGTRLSPAGRRVPQFCAGWPERPFGMKWTAAKRDRLITLSAAILRAVAVAAQVGHGITSPLIVMAHDSNREPIVARTAPIRSCRTDCRGL